MPSLSDLIGAKPENKVEDKIPDFTYIAMSLIKYVTNQGHEYKNYCPRELLEKIRGVIPNKKKAFKKGKLFETIVLGSGAKGDIVETLGEKKIGSGGIYKDETCLRLFAQLTKIKMSSLQIAVHQGINTQVPVICRVPNYPNIFLRTELDLFPTIINPDPDKDDSSLKLAAIDLKSAEDLDKGFGAYDWSKFSDLDHVQPDSIFYILDHLDLDLMKSEYPEFEKRVGYDNLFTPFVIKHLPNLKFYYLVAGYKMSLDLKNIRLFERLKCGKDESPTFRQREFEQRMLRTIERILWHYENNFDPIPYYNKYEASGCRFCPVNKFNNNIKDPDNWNGNLGYCTESENIQSC